MDEMKEKRREGRKNKEEGRREEDTQMRTNVMRSLAPFEVRLEMELPRYQSDQREISDR